MRRLKPIPAFATEAEGRAFWESHDAIEYVDWSKAKRVRLPNLQPSSGKPLQPSRPEQPR